MVDTTPDSLHSRLPALLDDAVRIDIKGGRMIAVTGHARYQVFQQMIRALKRLDTLQKSAPADDAFLEGLDLLNDSVLIDCIETINQELGTTTDESPYAGFHIINKISETLNGTNEHITKSDREAVLDTALASLAGLETGNTLADEEQIEAIQTLTGKKYLKGIVGTMIAEVKSAENQAIVLDDSKPIKRQQQKIKTHFAKQGISEELTGQFIEILMEAVLAEVRANDDMPKKAS